MEKFDERLRIIEEEIQIRKKLELQINIKNNINSLSFYMGLRGEYKNVGVK